MPAGIDPIAVDAFHKPGVLQAHRRCSVMGIACQVARTGDLRSRTIQVIAAAMTASTSITVKAG